MSGTGWKPQGSVSSVLHKISLIPKVELTPQNYRAALGSILQSMRSDLLSNASITYMLSNYPGILEGKFDHVGITGAHKLGIPSFTEFEDWTQNTIRQISLILYCSRMTLEARHLDPEDDSSLVYIQPVDRDSFEAIDERVSKIDLDIDALTESDIDAMLDLLNQKLEEVLNSIGVQIRHRFVRGYGNLRLPSRYDIVGIHALALEDFLSDPENYELAILCEACHFPLIANNRSRTTCSSKCRKDLLHARF